MSLTKKIASAEAAANEWRAGRSWAVLQADLAALGFYTIVRGSRPGQVVAYLDGVRYEL